MTLPQYLTKLPRPLFGKPSQRRSDRLQAQDFPHIPEELTRQVETLLELPFVPLGGRGNLCLIQSDEVLPEFRTSFHQLQLLDAIYASSISFATSNLTSGHIPVPSEPNIFWELSDYGKELRILHSLSFESFTVSTSFLRSQDPLNPSDITSNFPIFKEKAESKTGSIWINSTECFTDVPKAAWDLNIHGRQPAREALILLQNPDIRPEQTRNYQKCLYATINSLGPMEAITGIL